MDMPLVFIPPVGGVKDVSSNSPTKKKSSILQNINKVPIYKQKFLTTPESKGKKHIVSWIASRAYLVEFQEKIVTVLLKTNLTYQPGWRPRQPWLQGITNLSKQQRPTKE